jgi:hypothetical protein
MEHVAHLGEKRNAFLIFVGKHEGRNHLKGLCIEGKVYALKGRSMH